MKFKGILSVKKNGHSLKEPEPKVIIWMDNKSQIEQIKDIIIA